VLFEYSLCFCCDARPTVACPFKYRVLRSHLTLDVNVLPLESSFLWVTLSRKSSDLFFNI
jgi:hypothetical protein